MEDHHGQQDVSPMGQTPAPVESPQIKENDDDHDKSPESAAVARGAARTAASAGGKTATAATKGAIAGRLPVASRSAVSRAATPRIATRPLPRVVARTGGAPRTIPRAAAPRTLPRAPQVRVPRPRVHQPRSTPKLSSRIPKTRANTIARASDRASKGLDVLSAGLEQNQSSSDASSQIQKHEKSKAQIISKTMTRGIQQITSFGKIFVTNTILGMAVFATYEGVIEYAAPTLNQEHVANHVGHNQDEFCETSSDTGDNDEETITSPPIHDQINMEEVQVDAMDRATLPQHFMAGALGGAAHATLSLVMEMKLSLSGSMQSNINVGKVTNHTFSNKALSSKSVFLQVPALTYSASSIFHHSLAHSVLFGTYQLTKRMLMEHLPSYTTNNSSGSSGDAVHVSSIAIAGGLAGQFQHVTSHFSEQWLGLAEDMPKKSSSSSLIRRMALASWPTWRSTMLAFPPSAIGFLAFEYGKFMIAGAGDDMVDQYDLKDNG